VSKVRDKKKEAYWRRQFSEHKSSGKSIVEFCRRRRIPLHQFHWWKRRLSLLDDQDGEGQAENEPGFVPVRLPAFSFSVGLIEVVHPGGCVVRIPSGFDSDSLRRVLDTLGAPRSTEA
jgi:hypothetical protein